MPTIASKFAFASLAIFLFGATAVVGALSAEAGPGRITKLSGTDLGSGR